MAATATDIVVFVEPSEIDGNGWIADLELRAGISRARSREPSLEWSILLAQRGVPGAIGDR
jgi:hypothetical protein